MKEKLIGYFIVIFSLALLGGLHFGAIEPAMVEEAIPQWGFILIRVFDAIVAAFFVYSAYLTLIRTKTRRMQDEQKA